MNHRLIAPLVLLAVTPYLTSCTQTQPPVLQGPKSTQPAPVVVNTGVTTGTATLSTGAVATGTTMTTSTGETVALSTASGALTRTEVLSYDSRSPEGMVEVEFSVTVTDGVITAASATPRTDKKGSLYNQDSFSKALSGAVVGKKAKDLKLDTVGGASHTTAAFETFVQGF